MHTDRPSRSESAAGELARPPGRRRRSSRPRRSLVGPPRGGPSAQAQDGARETGLGRRGWGGGVALLFVGLPLRVRGPALGPRPELVAELGVSLRLPAGSGCGRLELGQSRRAGRVPVRPSPEPSLSRGSRGGRSVAAAVPSGWLRGDWLPEPGPEEQGGGAQPGGCGRRVRV